MKKQKIIQTDERPFVCKYCDKKLRQSGQMKQQNRIPIDEKPFPCE